jgi:uncharacterized protein (UPF0332 family)
VGDVLALSGTEQQLLRVSKATQKTMTAFKDGVFIANLTSRSLDDLREQVVADRLTLATDLAAVGDRLLKTRPVQYRSAIGRFYYSMYHSMRATVYFVYGGDDHERHDVLPKHTPADFPDSALWENRLKNARGHRNDADYDPYPRQHSDFRQAAADLQAHAHALNPLVRAYLRGKGCGYV